MSHATLIGGLPEERLSAHVAGLAAEPVSEATRGRLAQALLDWFTAGWSALEMDATATYRELATRLHPEHGKAPVFGSPVGLGALGAAFANGAITHLREIDDTHRAATLHPGVVAVSPVLALAAGMVVTHGRVAAAILAGYEVAIRVGEALGAGHYQRFHSTATAGSLGAAAAAGVMLGLDAHQMHHALGIAATQAAGLWQIVDDGAHESKALHPAFAVRNGVTAAYAAQLGLPGAKAFYSGQRGLHALLHGNGDIEALSRGLGEGDKLMEATIKAWPTCGQIFTALDCTAELMDELRSELAAEAESASNLIDTIEVRTYPQALKVAGVDWPSKPAETGFSPRYCVAMLAWRGRLGLAEMETPPLDDPALRALAARVQLVTDDEHERGFPQWRPCTVTLTLKDGRRLQKHRMTRRGDPEEPFDWRGMLARSQAFAPGMPAEALAEVAAWCGRVRDAAPEAVFEVPDEGLFGAG